MNTTQEVLQQCKVEGTVIKLPETQLDRKLYLDTKNKLELIGGKWKGGKVQGFVFPQDPTDLLEQISGGANRNLKKELQFFPTPDSLADRLIELAEPQAGEYILEPSAGQGAIVKAIQRKIDAFVDCYEISELNQTFLKNIPKVEIRGFDFLAHESSNDKYDRVIANPPFSKNQDIDHILKMYECLNDGGRIVTMASTHWRLSDNNKEKSFRAFLDSVRAEIYEVEPGAFKESGTTVATVIIVINK